MNTNFQHLLPELQNILDEECRSGNECGCQLAIYHHGKIVIDTYSGMFSQESNIPLPKNALFPIFSAGKPVLSALALILIDRGIVSLDTKIGELWKDFAVPEKSGITLEHLLSHRAGLYLLPPSERSEIANWELMCDRVGKMLPRNIPGKVCRYHPLTFAWLVGHTLELASGKSLPDLLKEYILIPCGVQNELFFGIDDKNISRLVPVDDALSPQKPSWLHTMMHDEVLRRCCIPSFNGIASARGLAKFYASLRGDLISEKLFDYAVSKLFRDANDPVTPGSWEKFALGFVLESNVAGHGGAAGSEGFYYAAEDIAVGFVKNRLRENFMIHPVRDRISAALGLPLRHW